MAWGKGCLHHLIAGRAGQEAAGAQQSAPIVKPVQNPGGDAYFQGWGPDYSIDIIDPFSGANQYGFPPYPIPGWPQPVPVANLPPLLQEGTAQRSHPRILALPQFSIIGTGTVHERDIQPCNPAGAVFDIQAWAQGLGQVANQIALVYGAGQLQGSGAAQNAGLSQLPFALPSEFSVAYVSTDGDLLTIPNASSLPFSDEAVSGPNGF